MELFNQFINRVQSGDLLSCGYVKKAVQRHVSDLEKSKNSDIAYYFNESYADRAIKIIKLLRHTQGRFKGKHFLLTDNQAFVLGSIFGWVRKDNDLRRFTKVYLEVARKWGKSEFCAALQVIFGLFDGNTGGHIVTAATKLPQCNHVFNAAKVMLRQLCKDEPQLAPLIKIRQYDIELPETNTWILRITSDPETNDGLNIIFAAVDEFHAHSNTGVLKVIETGVVSQEEPCTMIITTAGFNKNGPCYETRSIVISILEGNITNDNFFGLIFTLDPEDDWKDITVYPKSNPNMPLTPIPSRMEEGLTKALTEGSDAEIEFKTKNLNIWCDAPDVWISAEQWAACGDSSLKLEDYYGKKVVLGQDLSSEHDITALSILIPIQPGITKPLFFWKYYCPSSKVKGIKRVDGVNYRQWVLDGYMTMTDGNTIDYNYIVNDVMFVKENFEIIIMEYDDWGAKHVVPIYVDEGIAVNPHGQGWKSMNLPVRAFKKMVLSHPDNNKEQKDEELDVMKTESSTRKKLDTINYHLIHENNPITNWMLANCEVLYDPAGNQKLSKNSVKGGGKKKSNNKIDGILAGVMSVSGILFPPDSNESTYENNDLIVLR